jgi:hypothetical protein
MFIELVYLLESKKMANKLSIYNSSIADFECNVSASHLFLSINLKKILQELFVKLELSKLKTF